MICILIDTQVHIHVEFVLYKFITIELNIHLLCIKLDSLVGPACAFNCDFFQLVASLINK